VSSSVRSSIAGAIEATDWHRARLTHKKGQKGRLRVKIMSYVLALHVPPTCSPTALRSPPGSGSASEPRASVLPSDS